jgi:DNA polymerase (family 10)
MTKPSLSELPSLLSRTADLLRLSGANEFKAGAWDKASAVAEQEGDSLKFRTSEAELKELPNIGSSLAKQIAHFLEHGTLPELERLEAELPEGLIAWLDISGLGPKRAAKIHQQLEISTLDELKAALEDGRVAGLSGFGKKSASKILNALTWMEGTEERCLLSEAMTLQEEVRQALKSVPGVARLEFAGSLRRSRETIGDLDVLAVMEGDAAGLHQSFQSMAGVTEVLAAGDTKSSVRMSSGRQVDLRTVAEEHFPAAWIYFTGSKEHNVFLRGRARDQDLTLNEYGLYPLRNGEADRSAPVICKTEADVYKALGLPWTPPELREAQFQPWIEQNDLPELVEAKDLQGILHAHSTWSDGKNSIEEMARVCLEAGYGYLGITDHSKSAGYAGGLSPDRVEKQWKEIEALNQRFKDEGAEFMVFKGIESDILKNGSLDYDDDLLQGFDFVIASLHSVLDLEQAEMQDRIATALHHPATTILGHPTTRLLLKRPGVKLDMEPVIRLAAEQGVAIEINGQPLRLEMDWRWGALAREVGLLTAITPDAHAVDQLSHTTRYGIPLARKAGFSKERVLNTRNAPFER